MEKVTQRAPVDVSFYSRYRFGKRLFDIGFSFFLLVFFLPFIVLLSITLLVTSGRPIYFVQKRTGIDNSQFLILKFRTMMRSEADAKRHLYEWKEGVPDEFQFKTVSDDLVTPIGSVLRKYSLDELPQLINVLFGQMSMVGPRPEIPEITELYSNRQKKRLSVKPGMTGLAQINGRADLSHGEKMEFDLAYVETRNMRVDVKIVAATIFSVIRSKGAY